MKNKIFYFGLVLTIGLSSCSESSKEEISETEPSSGSSKLDLLMMKGFYQQNPNLEIG